MTNENQYPSAPEGTALAHLFETLRELGVGYAGAIGDGGKFECPNSMHDDENPSLDVHVGRSGKPIFTCSPCREAMGQDEYVRVLRDEGVRWSGDPLGAGDEVDWGDAAQVWSPTTKKGQPGEVRLSAVYTYKFADNTPNFKIKRYEPKKKGAGRKFFRPARFQDGGWVSGRGALDDVERTPYHFEDFNQWTEKRSVVYLVEGEKAADAVLDAGRAATTFHGGTACKMEDGWTDWFLGFAEVRIWPDADEAGVKWARARAADLEAAGVPLGGFWGVPATSKTEVSPSDDAADLLGRIPPRRLTEAHLDALADLKPLPGAPERASRGPETLTLPDGTVLVSAAAGGEPRKAGGVSGREREEPYRSSPTIAPYKFAEDFLDRHWRVDGSDSTLTLRFHDDRNFWMWDTAESRYVVVNEDEVRARVSYLVRDARAVNGDGETAPVNLKPSTVSHLVDCLRSDCGPHIGGVLLPTAGGVPFRNGWLNVSTGELEPTGPERDVRWNVPMDYDPSDTAAPREWLKFLDSLGWTPETEEYRLLRQWFGYLLSGRTDHQKAMLLLGPKRAGKGTVLKVAKGMLGLGAVGTQLDKLSSEFGLQNLLGASLVTIGDARFGTRTEARLVERILSMVADDEMTVNVKFGKPLNLRLGVRLMIATNEMPNFIEASDAIASRFLVLKFEETFFGREDLGLEHRVLRELGGIVRWALAGLEDLNGLGSFEETKAGKAIQHQMILDSAPLRVFVEENCILEPNAKVSNEDLYAEYVLWAEQNRMYVLNSVKFARDLMTAFPGQIKMGFYKRGGKNIRAKIGVKMR